jgi:hypothetical protein
MDTKPTIETILERLQDFRLFFEQQVAGINARLDKIEKEIQLTNKKLDKVILDHAYMVARLEMAEDRLERLEVGPNAPTQRVP